MKSKLPKKNLRLWFYLHNDDVKKVITKVIPWILILFAFKYLPFLLNTFFLSKLDSSTIGVIDTIEKIKGVSESSYGGTLMIKNYKVKFHYFVDELKIEQEEIIHYRSVNLKQKSFLKKMSIGDTIQVKYDSKNTQKSKLKLE